MSTEMFERPLCERYSFVMISTRNLSLSRRFWVDQLGFLVVEERPGVSFILDAGGLRLWVDAIDGEEGLPRRPDPAIGMKVRSVKLTLEALAARGMREETEVLPTVKGFYAIIHDPDGRVVVLTESME